MSTTFETTNQVLSTPDGPAAAGGAEVVLAPLVARALPLMTVRLRERHPAIPAEDVEHQVNLAAARLSRSARVHDYLPILIERMASAALAQRHPQALAG